jgi:hypothetical protein
VDKCKPLAGGPDPVGAARPAGRGSHSFASQLNLRDVSAIGGARRGCVRRVKGGVKGVLGVCRVFSCIRHGSS